MKQGEKMSEIKKAETNKKTTLTPPPNAQRTVVANNNNNNNTDNKANIEALQAQLKQAQSWVIESQLKAQEATAAAEKAIKERVNKIPFNEKKKKKSTNEPYP